MSGKLHQLLAVESDLEGKYKRICDETVKVFGKGSMFTGYIRKLELFDDSDKTAYPDEHLHMATTVKERLDYNDESVVDYFDAILQKEATNQTAVADLVIGETVIGKALPATFLLGMESRLKNLRAVYEAMPTLQVGIDWKRSETKGEDVWEQVHPEEKLKTKMMVQHQVLVDPTPQHRAEIEKWEEQIPVGKFVKNIWCSMITSEEKSDVLGRIDKLINAVKKARQEANGVPTVDIHVGKNIVDFIRNG